MTEDGEVCREGEGLAPLEERGQEASQSAMGDGSKTRDPVEAMCANSASAHDRGRDPSGRWTEVPSKYQDEMPLVSLFEVEPAPATPVTPKQGKVAT